MTTTSSVDSTAARIEEPDDWMASGEYLPAFMRDFHDQKDLFKAVHELVERSQAKHPTEHRMEGLTWVTAHIYTVDMFLWYMARRGYTLQRSRKRLRFRDIQQDVASTREQQHKQMAAVLLSGFAQHRASAQDGTEGEG